MGAPPNEEQLANMMSDPATAQALNEALDNPVFLDHLINSNPLLRNMPNAREMFRSPLLRSMISNPDYIRQAMRMQRQFRGGGDAGGFPAPGATDTTPADAPASNAAGANANAQGAGQLPPFSPFAMPPQGGMDPFGLFNPAMFAQAGQPGAAQGGSPYANPFAALFAPPGAPAAGTAASPTPAAGAGGDAQRSAEGATPAAGGAAGGAPTAQQPPAGLFPPAFFDPAAMTPERLNELMQLMGGQPLSPPPVADNRPPEERYADQLRQLNDMGFFDFDRNVAALRRSGGSVQGAIEHLLGGG